LPSGAVEEAGPLRHGGRVDSRASASPAEALDDAERSGRDRRGRGVVGDDGCASQRAGPAELVAFDSVAWALDRAGALGSPVGDARRAAPISTAPRSASSSASEIGAAAVASSAMTCRAGRLRHGHRQAGQRRAWFASKRDRADMAGASIRARRRRRQKRLTRSARPVASSPAMMMGALHRPGRTAARLASLARVGVAGRSA
jgi:hypothetical protein